MTSIRLIRQGYGQSAKGVQCVQLYDWTRLEWNDRFIVERSLQLNFIEQGLNDKGLPEVEFIDRAVQYVSDPLRLVMELG